MQTIYLKGLGAIGPGFANWPELASVLREEQVWSRTATQTPALQVLPAAERRRIGTVVKLALAAGLQAVEHAGGDTALLPSVFSSSNAEGENCHAICTALASDDRLISPTRFHNSVHNASSGYWSIATGCLAPSTSLCAFDASFTVGLLEASTQVAMSGEDCLLVVHDNTYPAPLGTARPLLCNMAIAFVLSAQAQPDALASLQISLSTAPPSNPPRNDITDLQMGAPCGRAIPLLHAIATGAQTSVNLEYLSPLSLQVEIAPCP